MFIFMINQFRYLHMNFVILLELFNQERVLVHKTVKILLLLLKLGLQLGYDLLVLLLFSLDAFKILF